MKFRKRPVVVDAVQWFKDGDYLTPTWGTCSDATYTLGFRDGSATLAIGGNTYSTDAFSLTGSDMEFVAEDGSTALVSVVITPHSKVINSGRAHYTRHWFTLDSGTVVLP